MAHLLAYSLNCFSFEPFRDGKPSIYLLNYVNSFVNNLSDSNLVQTFLDLKQQYVFELVEG